MRLRDANIKAVRSSLLLQAAPSAYNGASDTIYLGFTATKKIGNAVLRNRAKRRLRAAACDILRVQGRAEFDYVLIARKNTVQSPYDALCRDLKNALKEVHHIL